MLVVVSPCCISYSFVIKGTSECDIHVRSWFVSHLDNVIINVVLCVGMTMTIAGCYTYSICSVAYICMLRSKCVRVELWVRIDRFSSRRPTVLRHFPNTYSCSTRVQLLHTCTIYSIYTFTHVLVQYNCYSLNGKAVGEACSGLNSTNTKIPAS